MSTAASVHTNFLNDFFGPGNDIKWARVRPGSAGKAAKRLKPFLRAATADWTRLVLPRVNGSRCYWYVLARDPASARIVREELLAFVGPSYADFWGQVARLDDNDPVEQAVKRVAGQNVFRLEVVDATLMDACRNALERMLEVSERKPVDKRAVPRPVGRILRDFELSVQTAGRADAEAYLAELRHRGALSARNMLFLDVHLYASFGNWEALYDLLDDGALVSAPRPTRVTRALIQAVYRRELAQFEFKNEPTSALRHFVEVVQPQFGRLYLSMEGIDDPAAVKSFMISAAASQPANIVRRDKLLDSYPAVAADRGYVEELAKLCQGPAPILDGLEDARRRFAAGDLDATMEILLGEARSAMGLELLVRCAIEVGTIEATASALAAVNEAPADVRLELDRKRRVRENLAQLDTRFYAGASSLEPGVEPNPADHSLPQTWLEWTDRLLAEPEWVGAVEVAAQGALEWSVEAAGYSPTKVKALADRLDSSFGQPATETLSFALPHLVTFFAERAGPNPVFLPVQLSLIRLLILGGTGSLATIRAAGGLLETVMRGSVGREECQDAVELVQEAWLEQPAFDLIDWALDLFESLVTLQVAPQTVQVGFAGVLRGQLDRWRDRLVEPQVLLYEQLCREAYIESDTTGLRGRSSEDQRPGDDLAARLAGRTVGLYSLREEALTRAQAILRGIAPTVNVRLFSDKVLTDSLRNAARNFDVFVIVTGAAKHAATESIEANRPAGAVTLRCHATGSAGLLRCMRDWAAGVS